MRGQALGAADLLHNAGRPTRLGRRRGEGGPRRQPRQHRTNDLAAIAFPGRLNSVVQSAGSAAGGFGNTVYFKTVIFFRLGKLDFTARMQLSYAIHRK